MTIREIEEQSGMTRANIRFYETEGLLKPVRRSNGYRDYSEQDLETLLRIRLLRSLEISLEDIKALQSGALDLPETLDRQIRVLEQEQKRMERSGDVCREMRDNGVRYETLNPRKYLDDLTSGISESVAVSPAQDVIPKVRSPWRRFFAREIDALLYGLIWAGIYVLGFHHNPARFHAGDRLLTMICEIGLNLLLEPLFLQLFGATPGKLLLGLSVQDGRTGRRLRYGEALARTWQILWHGLGLMIPIYHLVRLWKSKRACEDGETLPWEYDSELELRDESRWRVFGTVASYGAYLGAVILIVLAAELPAHRGSLTVSEFCDNYNQYAAWYMGRENILYTLQPDGSWKQRDSGAVIIHVFDGGEPPKVHFTTEDGVMTGLEFHVETENGESLIAQSYAYEMAYSVLAFARAQPAVSLTAREARDAAAWIESHPHQSYRYSLYGVDVTCDIRFSGYQAGTDFLFAEEGAATSYSLTFSVQKQ